MQWTKIWGVLALLLFQVGLQAIWMWKLTDPHRYVSSSSISIHRKQRIQQPQAADFLSKLEAELFNFQAADMSIPPVIHQSYKTEQLPDRFREWQATWKLMHPKWHYRFWTDEDNKRLVTESFPWFYQTYKDLPEPIMRADAARYMYMFKYGGIYADLDFECLKPMGDLVRGKHLLLARMGNNDSFTHSVPNAFFASRPGHPFWVFCLLEIQLQVEQYQLKRHYTAEGVTGPKMLHRVLYMYWNPALGMKGIDILPPAEIYPFDWKHSSNAVKSICHARKATFNSKKCKKLFPDAYAITYWAHSWGNLTQPQAMGQQVAGGSALKAAVLSRKGARNGQLRGEM